MRLKKAESTRPAPHSVPPHIVGCMTVSDLPPEIERSIQYAVYGPRNWLNVDQLRRCIKEALALAALKGDAKNG